MSKEYYTLQNRTECLGVYSSKQKLSKAVDYWMKRFPRSILYWLEHKLNYIPEPFGWEWAYIPLGTKLSRLTSGGGTAPMRKYWGHNLVAIQNRGIHIFEDLSNFTQQTK